ncbi:MAG: diol dehydratase small subunit [Deltaproteobacteria bacterium]|nr:diol dehydratase small subunit [Deltaproteobacteria bacterium]
MAETKGLNVTPDQIAEAVKRVMAALQGGSGKAVSGKPSGDKLDAGRDYPLAIKRPDLVKSAGGMGLDDITLEKVISGKIQFDDVKTRPETLEYQAQIAESVHRPRLASNLRRAAEMTRIPDARVLEMYNALRPYRSTKQELLDIAKELETEYQAKVCASLVREAAEAYEKRGRLRKD